MSAQYVKACRKKSGKLNTCINYTETQKEAKLLQNIM